MTCAQCHQRVHPGKSKCPYCGVRYPSGPVMTAQQVSTTRVSAEQRRAALQFAISQALAYGYRIESQTETHAYLVTVKRPNHALHVILSLVTLGLWLLVWLIVVLVVKENRLVITVDEYGNVFQEQVS